MYCGTDRHHNIIKGIENIMSIAKIKNTQDIVHGKHLKSMTQDEISRTEFVCPYDECEMPAIPCAYKETNKVESYFKYKKHHLS